MKTIIKKINLNALSFYLFAILVAAIPFQGFLLTWARQVFNLSGFSYSFISFWKEFILAVLLIIIGAKYLKEKSLNIKILKIDKIILVFLALVFLYILLFNLPLSQKLAGLRYDTEFLLFYFVVRILNFDVNELKKLFYIFLAFSIPVIIFGLLQISIISPDFMLRFGYSGRAIESSRTGILSTFDAIDPILPNVFRIQSTFPGAIQFGSYIVLISAFFLAFAAYLKDRTKFLYILGFFLSICALYGTQTRSAWIAAVVSLFIVFSYFIKNKKVLVAMLILISVSAVVALGVFFNNPKVQKIILHGEIRNGGQLFGSTQAHYDSLLDGTERFVSKPFGNGIGFAGPASKGSSNIVITENGYLQIGIELGYLGLITFLLVILGFMATIREIIIVNKDIFQKCLSIGVLSSLVGVSVNALFLHTFSDTATVYPLFIFIGILFSLNQKELT